MARKRGNAIADALPWIVIGLAVLVIVFIASGGLKGSGTSILDKINSLLGGFGG